MCKQIPANIITFGDVEKFFQDRWAPQIVKMFQPSSDILNEMLDDITRHISDLEVYEVYCKHSVSDILKQSLRY